MALLKRALAATEYATDDPSSTVEGASAAAAAAAPAGGRRLFELMVAQLSEADVIAHCSGAAPRIDPSGGYVHALANTSGLLASLLSSLDSRTTLLILSDHGAVDHGGAGGAEPLAVDVPLVAYRAGSALGSRRPSSGRAPLRTVDVAPTLSLLLGLPAPRHSEGEFIDVSTGHVTVVERSWNARGTLVERSCFGHGTVV